MSRHIIRYTAMVVTAIIFPIAAYAAAVWIYKFYLLLAGFVTAEYKEMLAFCSMIISIIGVTNCIVAICAESDTKNK